MRYTRASGSVRSAAVMSLSPAYRQSGWADLAAYLVSLTLSVVVALVFPAASVAVIVYVTPVGGLGFPAMAAARTL